MLSFLDLQGYSPLLLKGFWRTITVGLATMGVSIVWGLILSLAHLQKQWPWLKRVVVFYVNLMRSVPELVLLLVLYYGIPNLVQEVCAKLGYEVTLNISPFWSALIALSGIYGSFAAEVFRSSLQQVPKGCLEAAYTLGMSKQKIFFHVSLPLAASHAVAGLSNVWMMLIKATAVTSVIQMPELMYSTDLAVRATHAPFLFYFFTCFLYLAITLLSVLVQSGCDYWLYIPSNKRSSVGSA